MLHAKENDTVKLKGDEGKDKVLALEIRLNRSPAERIWQWKKFNKFILCATVSCFPLLLKNVASLVPRGVKGPCCWDDVTHRLHELLLCYLFIWKLLFYLYDRPFCYGLGTSLGFVGRGLL